MRNTASHYIYVVLCLLLISCILSGEDTENITCSSDAATDIFTASDLRQIDLEGSYCLVADIDLSHIPNFDPLGSENDRFQGTLDGQGHTIRGLNIATVAPEQGGGLFSHIGDLGTVRRLTIEDARLTVDATSHGALAALNYGRIEGVTIRNVAIDTAHEDGLSGVGGLVGINYGTIRSGSSSGAITQIPSGNSLITLSIGGLVGLNRGTIQHSRSTVKLSRFAAVFNTGGLVGRNESEENTTARIEYCSANSSISGGVSTGGLVGTNAERALIMHSYATGTVTGTSAVGGLVGENRSDAQIEDSYAIGLVTGFNTSGGFIGSNDSGEASIQRSYTRGTVSFSVDGSAAYFMGAFAGISNPSSIADSFYDKTINPDLVGIGETGAPQEGVRDMASGDITTQASFDGNSGTSDNDWNFATVWRWLAPGQWPVLQWQ